MQKKNQRFCSSFTARQCFRLTFLLWALAFLFTAIPSRASILENKISMETRLVEFDIGGGHYAIPRNYLYQMDSWNGGPQEVVSIRLDYPELSPVVDDNKDCFLRRKVCRLYDLVMLDTAMETTRIFSNMTDLFHKPYPKHGPYGLELYEVGPENARIEFYRKITDGHTVVFICDLFDNRGKRDAICHNVTRTRSGATLSYYFPIKDLHAAAEVDKKLRDLIDSFSLRGKK
jgi:hypothetical protein